MTTIKFHSTLTSILWGAQIAPKIVMRIPRDLYSDAQHISFSSDLALIIEYVLGEWLAPNSYLARRVPGSLFLSRVYPADKPAFD
jgi:hypothetical protein